MLFRSLAIKVPPPPAPHAAVATAVPAASEREPAKPAAVLTRPTAASARPNTPPARPTAGPARPTTALHPAAAAHPAAAPTGRARSTKAALANVPATATAAAASDALVANGRAAFAKGDFAQAVRLGRQAAAVGDSLGGRLLLGDAFFKMNRFADALREYGAAARLAPSNAQAVRGQELARQRLGTE